MAKRTALCLVALVMTAACGAMASMPVQANEPSAAPDYLETPPGEKPRVIITTDPELDDLNSLIRYLLYSGDFRTEGLVYASSQFHWKGDGQGTEWFVAGREYDRPGMDICPCTSWRWAEGERFIDDALDAYATAFPNLRIHDPDYPEPEALRAKVRWGNVQFDGDITADSAGSDLIRAVLLDDEEAPVYLHAWGGQSTIARALLSIEEAYGETAQWPEIRAKVVRKAVISAFGDQDGTYASYISVNWPDIRYREPAGGLSLAYAIQNTIDAENAEYFSPEWTRENISSRGELGALYRVWGDGKQMVEGDIFDFFGIAGQSAEELRAEGYFVWTGIQAPGAFISEGDTPTFLNLVDNGLEGFRSERFGGWGAMIDGRSADMAAMFGGDAGSALQARGPVARSAFYGDAQRDLAVRFDWATTPNFADANHHPRIDLLVPEALTVQPGQQVTLDAVASDPDGDAVTLHWWRWDDVDSYAGGLPLTSSEAGPVSLTIPSDMKEGETLHFVLEARDDGAPALTRYARVVLTATGQAAQAN
jgi:hypothetical protein